MIKQINIDHTPTAEQVLKLQRKAYQIEADLIGYDAIPPLLETLDELQRSTDTYIAQFEANTLTGVLAYERDVNGPLQSVTICKLIVAPEHFNKGIGTLLMRHLMERYPNATEYWVTTSAKNTPALRLYEKLGFQAVDKIAVNDQLVLTKLKKKPHPGP